MRSMNSSKNKLNSKKKKLFKSMPNATLDYVFGISSLFELRTFYDWEFELVDFLINICIIIPFC